jgi:tetratricopeptide (TPR) repeat protein
MPISTSSSDHRHGVTLGRFRILSHIASGGMGAVYRAYDPDNDRQVALKVLPHDLLAGKPVLIERFRREAQHGSKLRHENIVTLYEFGETGGTCFLVMELIEGTNLQDHIAQHGPLTPAEARRLLIQVTRALDYVHRQGLVHRDIKPANILLDRPGPTAIAKLTDLGLARASRDEEFRITREGYTVGTVDYMAPEQARDSSKADIRSDIYSLGCTFFHALTGQPPFPEGTLPERLYKHAEAEPPDVRMLNPAVPDDLAAILDRMLAKRPEDRYQTPAELLDDLLHEGRLPSKPGPAEFPPRAAEVKPEAPTPVPAPSPTLADKNPAEEEVQPGSDDIVAGQLTYAREQIQRGQLNMGLRLLLACCRRAPARLECHQALREALEARTAAGYRNGLISRLSGALPWLRFKLVKQAADHRAILVRGAEVLVHFPNDLAIQLDMAEAADKLGQHDLALWLLLQARKDHKQETAINRALGRYFERRKDFDQALSYWKRVAKADPTDDEVHKKLRDLAALQTLVRTKRSEGRKL